MSGSKVEPGVVIGCLILFVLPVLWVIYSSWDDTTEAPTEAREIPPSENPVVTPEIRRDWVAELNKRLDDLEVRGRHVRAVSLWNTWSVSYVPIAAAAVDCDPYFGISLNVAGLGGEGEALTVPILGNRYPQNAPEGFPALSYGMEGAEELMTELCGIVIDHLNAIQ